MEKGKKNITNNVHSCWLVAVGVDAVEDEECRIGVKCTLLAMPLSSQGNQIIYNNLVNEQKLSPYIRNCLH